MMMPKCWRSIRNISPVRDSPCILPSPPGKASYPFERIFRMGEQGAKQVKEDICVRKAADFIVDNAKEAKAAAKKTTKKEKAAEEKPEEA